MDTEKISAPLLAEAARRYDLSFVRRARERGGRALIFGGAIRDAVLGKAWKELDIRIIFPLSLAERDSLMESVLAESGVAAPVKISLGDALTVYRFVPPGSASSVDIDLSVARDLADAGPDFTVNGLYLDMGTGEIIDGYGALDAISRRVIRTAGVPAEQVVAEPHITFRAVKAACQFGFGIDEETRAAAKANAGALSGPLASLADRTIGGLTEWMLANVFKGLKYDPARFASLWDELGVTPVFGGFLRDRLSAPGEFFEIGTTLDPVGGDRYEAALSAFFSAAARALDPQNPEAIFERAVNLFALREPKRFEDFVVDSAQIKFA